MRFLELIFGLWRRSIRDAGRLKLWEVLRRRGTRRLAHRHGRSLEFAVERCIQCSVEKRCEHALATGGEGKIDVFCPNAMYLRHLDAMLRHEPKRSLLGPET